MALRVLRALFPARRVAGMAAVAPARLPRAAPCRNGVPGRPVAGGGSWFWMDWDASYRNGDVGNNKNTPVRQGKNRRKRGMLQVIGFEMDMAEKGGDWGTGRGGISRTGKRLTVPRTHLTSPRAGVAGPEDRLCCPRTVVAWAGMRAEWPGGAAPPGPQENGGRMKWSVRGRLFSDSFSCALGESAPPLP